MRRVVVAMAQRALLATGILAGALVLTPASPSAAAPAAYGRARRPPAIASDATPPAMPAPTPTPAEPQRLSPAVLLPPLMLVAVALLGYGFWLIFNEPWKAKK
ncbi:MAG: hypothetical protein FJ029_12260 [Actinobacteria bacterium]|nr:hypothetical protein [Actinomycetota bacterium]